MYVKHLIGARRGDVEDLPFEIAKGKVLRGEAEDVYEQLGKKPATAVMQPEVQSNRPDSVSMGAAKQKLKRR